MFEQVGKNQGEFDGHADANNGYKVRPRPDLTLAIISSGYRDSYLAAYKKSYGIAQYIKAQQKMREVQQIEKNNALSTVAKTNHNNAFDKGWKDGFAGQANDLVSLKSNKDKQAYERGYALGCRDNDFARAKVLRQAMENTMTPDQKSPNTQANIGRGL